MRFIAVEHSDSDSLKREITLRLKGEDSKSYPMTLPEEAAIQVTFALRLAATRLPPRKEFERVYLYTLKQCQPLVTDAGAVGLTLTTAEGFEIPLVLDDSSRHALSACIAQLEAGAKHDGPTH